MSKINLNFEKLPNKNLNHLNINWYEFRKKSLNYYLKWMHILKTDFFLETIDCNLPYEKNARVKLKNVDQVDNLLNKTYFNKIKNLLLQTKKIKK